MSNPYPAAFADDSGVDRLEGAVTFTDPGNQPGAGLQTAEFLFTERATAGTYTATLPIATGAVVQDIYLYALVGAWAADTALFDVGDTQGGPGSYYPAASYDLVSAFNDYDPVNESTANTQTISVPSTPYQPAGYASTAMVGVRYAAADAIVMTVVTTIAVPPVVPTGILLVKVLYFAPVVPTPASFA